MAKEIKLPAVDSTITTAGRGDAKFEQFTKNMKFYGGRETRERIPDVINKTNNGWPGSKRKGHSISLRGNRIRKNKCSCTQM